MKPVNSIILLALFLAGTPGPAKSAPRSAPPAGDYPGLTSYLGYSPVQGPAGPMMIIQFAPSAIGELHLDGHGIYRLRSGSGRYSFSPTSGAFAFVSGPLKGWPAVYEVNHGTPTVRLAGRKTDTVGPGSRIGEHLCRRRGNEKFSDTPAVGRGGAGGSSTRSRSRFRGALTFRESWGSDSIVDVDLATGRVQSRFEGTEAYRSAGGETVFINRQGALVIAGRNGVTAAMIPVPQADERPDWPVLSPDGTRVAYHVAPIYWDSRVVVCTRDGKRVAEFKGVTEPAWTPDGRLVVANSLKTQGAQAAISLSDTALTRLQHVGPILDDSQMPAVSPDGKRVAFVNHSHIWVMGLDGTGLKQVTFSSGGEERPAWSPDGLAMAVGTKTYGVVTLVSLPDGKMIELKNSEDRTMQSGGRITWR